MNDAALRELLEGVRTIAVVGCSADPSKPAHTVPERLQRLGFRIIPVNPTQTTILGEKTYAAIADVTEPYDLVDVFRPSHAAGVVTVDAIAAGAPAIWLQLGISSTEGKAAAATAGITYVEDRCLWVDVERLGIRPV